MNKNINLQSAADSAAVMHTDISFMSDGVQEQAGLRFDWWIRQ